MRSTVILWTSLESLIMKNVLLRQIALASLLTITYGRPKAQFAPAFYTDDTSSAFARNAIPDYYYDYEDDVSTKTLPETDKTKANYQFSYGVTDDEHGTYHSRTESADDSGTSGQYQVELPDGRTQTVKYTADENGYRAEVTYEGEAVHDDHTVEDDNSISTPSRPVRPKPIPQHDSRVTQQIDDSTLRHQQSLHRSRSLQPLTGVEDINPHIEASHSPITSIDDQSLQALSPDPQFFEHPSDHFLSPTPHPHPVVRSPQTFHSLQLYPHQQFPQQQFPQQQFPQQQFPQQQLLHQQFPQQQFLHQQLVPQHLSHLHSSNNLVGGSFDPHPLVRSHARSHASPAHKALHKPIYRGSTQTSNRHTRSTAFKEYITSKPVF